MRFNDRSADGESHAEALRLGGHERLENTVQVFASDSAAPVANGAHHLATAAFEARRDRDAALVYVERRHRLAGVDDQVEDDLLQLDAITQDQRQIGIEYDVDRNVSRQEIVPRKFEHVLDHVGQVDGLAGNFAALEHGTQSLDDFGRADVVGDDVADHVPDLT